MRGGCDFEVVWAAHTIDAHKTVTRARLAVSDDARCLAACLACARRNDGPTHPRPDWRHPFVPLHPANQQADQSIDRSIAHLLVVAAAGRLDRISIGLDYARRRLFGYVWRPAASLHHTPSPISIERAYPLGRHRWYVLTWTSRHFPEIPYVPLSTPSQPSEQASAPSPGPGDGGGGGKVESYEADFFEERESVVASTFFFRRHETAGYLVRACIASISIYIYVCVSVVV